MVPASKRKEAAWKEVLEARDEAAKERCIEAYKEEKRKVKRCIYQSKKKVNEQFGKKRNKDVNGKKKKRGPFSDTQPKEINIDRRLFYPPAPKNEYIWKM